MLAHINLANLIFIDIETVPCVRSAEHLSENLKTLWAQKYANLRSNPEHHTAEAAFAERAGVFAEFAKVICISIGFLRKNPATDSWEMRIKSFADHNEKQLLTDFQHTLKQRFGDTERYSFCGHNINEFDIPFLSRRMLINDLELPEILDHSGKKPWQMHNVDTLELWKFGDRKNYTSLNLLAEIFRLPTPKDDISGKDVARVYWQENNLERIKEYCQKDTATIARLMLKFKGVDKPLDNHAIHIVG